MKADDFLSNIQSNGVPGLALRSDGASAFGLIVDEVLLSVVELESNDRSDDGVGVAVPVSDLPICIKFKVLELKTIDQFEYLLIRDFLCRFRKGD